MSYSLIQDELPFDEAEKSNTAGVRYPYVKIGDRVSYKPLNSHYNEMVEVTYISGDFCFEWDGGWAFVPQIAQIVCSTCTEIHKLYTPCYCYETETAK